MNLKCQYIFFNNFLRYIIYKCTCSRRI